MGGSLEEGLTEPLSEECIRVTWGAAWVVAGVGSGGGGDACRKNIIWMESGGDEESLRTRRWEVNVTGAVSQSTDNS